MKVFRIILLQLMLILGLNLFSLAQDTINTPPWKNKAPLPYSQESSLVNDSYKEQMKEANIENYPEAVKKAKEVLQEWGQNPDKYEYQGKYYKYGISVFENKDFISVVFAPISLDISEAHVEIRMVKKNLEVLSILPGP